MSVIIPCVQAVTHPWSHVVVPEPLTECVLVVAFVSRQTSQVARVPSGDLRPNIGIVPPFRRGLYVEDGLGLWVYQDRRFQRLYLVP